jgi:hypothetical protein
VMGTVKPEVPGSEVCEEGLKGRNELRVSHAARLPRRHANASTDGNVSCYPRQGK